jgi:EpsI family protein
VNRYLVSKGQSRSLVIYWYQSKNRAIASEFQAKAYLVWDALRYNRSDTALVRVVLPVREGNEKEAEEAALDFVRALQPHVQTYFPS